MRPEPAFESAVGACRGATPPMPRRGGVPLRPSGPARPHDGPGRGVSGRPARGPSRGSGIAGKAASRGITVTARASLGRDDAYARVTIGEITSLVAGTDPRALADAEALVLSCTGWPTLGVVSRLEQGLGMPVISSNLAMARYCAELCG